ncbi:50S ribosomal protein L34e [Candidatus Woesearchaeota archaeon]|nr:50S ribosomal protein L34e [Candidatus Woesearchaeota archaeon]
MVAGRHKSRSMRRVFRKTPGGKVVVHYRKKKPKLARCGSCGAVLKGVVRERPYKLRNMPKTKKRPTRPYGGVLCTKCLRKLMIEKART